MSLFLNIFSKNNRDQQRRKNETIPKHHRQHNLETDIAKRHAF